MPKFYFHFEAAGTCIDDQDGKELASLGDAHKHAVRLVEQATAYFDDARDWRGWTVRICSGGNRLLLTVLFPFRGESPVSRRRSA
jgi:hypothetical protein